MRIEEGRQGWQEGRAEVTERSAAEQWQALQRLSAAERQAEALQAQQNAFAVERRAGIAAMPRIVRKGGSVPAVPPQPEGA